METNRVNVGVVVSAILLLPIVCVDWLIAFNPSLGGRIFYFQFLPFLFYLAPAIILRWRGYSRLGRGLALGGILFSIVILVVFDIVILMVIIV